MTDIKTLITNDKIKGIIAIAAAVIMYFTPDYVDEIIQIFLAYFGITNLVIKEK